MAATEFVRPALHGGPVLIRMHAPAGTHAAWVTGMSDDVTLKYQLELLMQDVVVEFVGVDTTTNPSLPILEVMIR